MSISDKTRTILRRLFGGQNRNDPQQKKAPDQVTPEKVVNRDISDWNSWQRIENARAHSWDYARFLEPNIREILPHLERINEDFAFLNRHFIHSWANEGWWTINDANFENGVLQLKGFIVPPDLAPLDPVVLINGSPVADQASNLPSWLEDRLMPFRPQNFGFSASIPIADATAIEETLEISIATKSQSSIFRSVFPHLNCNYLAPSWGAAPPAPLLARIGERGGNNWMFQIHGGTFLHKVNQLSIEYLGKPISELNQILDWGCGCGRVLRFIEPTRRQNVTAVDIDPVGIDWCKVNLPGPQYVNISASPPLPFRDGSFDLVYGNSIFTHLTESDQFAWLKELQRVTRRGGIVAVTIHARISWCVLGWFEVHSLLTLLSRGIRVSSQPNPDISEIAGSSYVDTHHTHEYIYAKWSRYFEVCGIFENFAGTLALVVLRAR